MVKKGPWTPEEDMLLTSYIQAHGVGQWRTLPKKAGLQRCGKGCRLRWMNYLRPNVKRGNISLEEEELIIRLHKLLGNRWSLIAGRVPGRTDNEIKNYWNTRLSKKLRLGSEAPRYSRKTNGSSHPRSYSSIPQENASAFCNKNDINSGDDDPEKPMCRQNPSTSLLEELLGLGSCNTQLQQQQQQDTNSTGGRHEQTVAEENNYNVATALLQDSFFQDDLNLVWSSSDIGNNPMWLSADPATDQFQDENQRFFMIQQQHNSNSNINNHNGGSNHNGLDLQYCLNNQNVSFLPAATLFKTHEDGDDTANTNNNNSNNTNNAVVLQSHQECLLDNPCSSPWPGYYFFLA